MLLCSIVANNKFCDKKSEEVKAISLTGPCAHCLLSLVIVDDSLIRRPSKSKITMSCLGELKGSEGDIEAFS